MLGDQDDEKGESISNRTAHEPQAALSEASQAAENDHGEDQSCHHKQPDRNLNIKSNYSFIIMSQHAETA